MSKLDLYHIHPQHAEDDLPFSDHFGIPNLKDLD